MASANPDEIVALVRKELFLYQGLLEQQRSQLNPLYKANPAASRQQGILQQRAVRKIKKVEEQLRQTLQGEPLTRAARRLGHPHGTVLRSLIEQFQMVIREISLVNARNERFIRSGFWAAESALSRIFGTASSYNSAGHSTSSGGHLLRRALNG